MLDGTFLLAIKQETEKYAGGRVDKIHQPSREEIVISIRSAQGNIKILASSSGTAGRIHITHADIENPQTPPMFCMLLRKKLSGAKFLGIRQEGLERILYLDFEALNELGDTVRLTLVSEIMGKYSNLILINGDGKIVDSILHGMQEGLEGTSSVASLSAMYGIQAAINFIIPSATAKAAITIPIMAPFSDMVGVSRQAMVLAFQFGDGFTNMVTPTSGVLMASLAMARIPYSKWVKWIWKGVVALLVLGFLLLLPTAIFSIGGF